MQENHRKDGYFPGDANQKAMEEKIASLEQSEYRKQMDLLTPVKGIGVTLTAAPIEATGGFT